MHRLEPGRWVERGLLLAVLLVQLAMLVQWRAYMRRADPLAVSPASGASGASAVEASPGMTADREGRVVPRALNRTGQMAEDMGALMAGAMENVALLQSAMHFHRGWDALRASPSLDMRHTDGGYLVTFSIPGVRPDELGVMLEGRVLTVRALCGTSAFPGGMRTYERRVLLPGPVGAVEDAQAHLTNGVLRVHIPKGVDFAPSHAVTRLF